MALPGSHIRVALAVKDLIGAVDLAKYLSGTIYPDSRTFTGLARELTHGLDQRTKDFYQSDDFKKGWAIHLLYDRIQLAYIKKTFPDLFDDIENKLTQDSDNWITLTAIKVYQDIRDISLFPLNDYLPYLSYCESANNEPKERLEEYNENIKRIYSEPSSKPTDYYERFVFLGTKVEYAANIVSRAEELAKDSSVMERIDGLFDETMKLFYDTYPTL